MSPTASSPPGSVEATGLGKAYRRYARRSDRLLEWIGRAGRHQLHWVLRDIDLSIAPGESVGIVGVNGAGKSTLLKLVAGVLSPTSGSVRAHGRVAALLELGLGFHPDFTGRENVRLAALMAGFTQSQCDVAMPDIAAFAEIGDYIDQPVRTYSSGMMVRLAFSVATAWRPDVLIIDEALAVGDVFFQQKCFERIRSFCAQGTTLFFVSHSAATVYALCERAVLIDGGRIARDGPSREVLDLYSAMVASRSSHRTAPAAIVGLPAAAPSGAPAQTLPGEPGSGGAVGSYRHPAVRIAHVELRVDGEPAATVLSGVGAEIRIQVAFDEPLADPHVGLQVRDRRGEAVFMTHTHAMGQRIGPVRADDLVEVRYSLHLPLAPGAYTLTAGVADGGVPGGELVDSLARHQDALSFEVVASLDDIRWSGLVNLQPEVDILRPATRPLPGGLLVTTSHSLLWVDPVSGRSHPLHRGAGLYYGIASDGQRVAVAARRRMVSSPRPAEGERGVILVFDARMRLCDTWHAPFPLRDLHEIRFHEGALWATCAFDNMVAVRHPQGRWEAWYPLGEPQVEPRDLNHFNSLAFTPGRLHLLAHNRGVSEHLQFSLPDRQLLQRTSLGVQAHNLWLDAGAWRTCSSGEGRLVGEGGFDVPTGAFPRGVCRLTHPHAAREDMEPAYAVGLSELAERRHRDLTTPQLLILDSHWRTLHRWSLPGEGLLLDILAWPDVQPEPARPTGPRVDPFPVHRA